MASRYVPPHMRKQESGVKNERSSNLKSEDLAAEVLWPRRLADLEIGSDRHARLNTLAEIHLHYGKSTTKSTLHDSAKCPGRLAYVVLFRGANPRWNDDNIIFAHSNIDLLPGYAGFKLNHERSLREQHDDINDKISSAADVDSGNPNAYREVASAARDTKMDGQPQHTDIVTVYMERNVSHGTSRRYEFHGFFTISTIDFLQPYSPELIRMLRQKWNPTHPTRPEVEDRTKPRDSEAWRHSLNRKWAVVKFERVPIGSCPAEPLIEVLPDELQGDLPGRVMRSGDQQDPINMDSVHGSGHSNSGPAVMETALSDNDVRLANA